MDVKTSGQVAIECGVRVSDLVNAERRGDIPRPTVVMNRRLWMSEEVAAAKAYFQTYVIEKRK